MIVIDVETTGVNPDRHGLISIGAVDFRTLDPFYIECHVTDREISEAALAINGFTRDDLADDSLPSSGDALTKFFAWASSRANHVIAGHHPEFDVGFLRAEADRCGCPWLFGRRLVDLHSICFADYLRRGLDPPLGPDGSSALTLDAILAYVGLPAEPRPHCALTGAKLAAEALARIIYEQGLFTQYARYPLVREVHADS